MTHEEKQRQMEQRNADICSYYKADHNVAECGKRFGLKRQRILQILQASGVWQPYEKTGRDVFLGISLTEGDKAALRAEAERRGVSMSALSAEAIKEMLAALPQGAQQ